MSISPPKSVMIWARREQLWSLLRGRVQNGCRTTLRPRNTKLKSIPAIQIFLV
jgi:hypothetical protein